MRETSDHNALVRTRGQEDRANIERMLTEATKAISDAWAEVKTCLTTPTVEDEAYMLTPEGEDIIRDLVEHTAMAQDAVTAAGDALDVQFDAEPDRYVRNVSGRDHAVSANARAVRDLIDANALIASAVAILGHEAADTIMRNLITPGVHAAAA